MKPALRTIKFIVISCLLSALFLSCGYETLGQVPEQKYEPVCDCKIEKQTPTDQFWFVQITDIEQTRLSGSEIAPFAIPARGDYETFLRQLRYIYDSVSPQFVVATGDLVYGGILRQVPEQWDDYRNAVYSACFNDKNFHDLPGNHDVMYVKDFSNFRQNSISGKIHYDWTHENSFGRFAFIAFNTARPGKVDGYFSSEERSWLTERLNQYEDYDFRLIFAHHNRPGPHMGDLFGNDGVLARHKVQGFFGGHIHKDDEGIYDDALVFQTDTTYAEDNDSVDGRFRIVSFDGRSFASASKWILHHGPQVLISHPQDRAFATSANPNGHVVSGLTPIRALAFSSDDVYLSVYIDDDGPYSMRKIDEYRHEVEIDFSNYPHDLHEIHVLAEGYEGDSDNPQDSIEIEVSS